MEEIQLKRFRVTSPVAVGIVDPYTGDELVVEGVVRGPVVTFSAPDAFTLCEPQKDVRVLYARASMRNGVEGVVNREESLKCAYTGRPLRLERLGDGRWFFSGGFNPRRGYPSLAEFVRLASRGERCPEEPPKGEMSEPLKGEAVDKPSTECVGEELSEVAEKTVKALGADKGRTTVSMAGRRGKR